MALIKFTALILSLFVLIAACPGVSSAEEANKTEKHGGWEFGAQVYLWGAFVSGKTGSGRNISVDFGDVISNLEFGFMGTFGVRKDKWSLYTDVIYLYLAGDTTVGPGLRLDASLSGWVVTPALGYSFYETDLFKFEVLGGARYLYLNSITNLGPRRDDVAGSVWDGIVGLKANLKLSENWYMPFYVDIGTGESDITWQASGGIGYKFKWVDLVATYRYLSWDFSNDKLLADLALHGPVVGIRFTF